MLYIDVFPSCKMSGRYRDETLSCGIVGDGTVFAGMAKKLGQVTAGTGWCLS